MPKTVEPRNFFLNERHELARGERSGGRQPAPFTNINWREKSVRIHTSMDNVRTKVRNSKGPLNSQQYFVLARPPKYELLKASTAKTSKGGVLKAEVSYGESDSRVFGRLGLDLIQANRDGSAIVHARPDVLEHLFSSSEMLDEFSAREKARWATIEAFEIIPPDFRYDREWLMELGDRIVPAIIELQPLVTAIEADQVIHAIAGLLKQREGEGVKGIGADFSGRQWLRARLTRSTIIDIAKTFFSVQSIHPPLISVVTGPKVKIKFASKAIPSRKPIDAANLPCVGILDTESHVTTNFSRPIGEDSFCRLDFLVLLPEIMGRL